MSPRGGLRGLAGFCMLLAFLGGCEQKYEAVTTPLSSQEHGPVQPTITGTATYRERMALPPEAELQLTLEDVSRADATADILSASTVVTSRAPPYNFSIPYDPHVLVENHRYVVRAKIVANQRLLFTSDTSNPVLGKANITHVDIVLRRVGAGASATPAPASQMRGMYSYMADAGWFTDCKSGARLPVAQEGDNAALEAAYSKSTAMAGAPALAVVEGRIEERLPMEGSTKRPTLLVDKFVSIEAQGCSGPQSTAQLENTYWKLMTLGDAHVASPAGTREIHFVLHSASQRVNGFAGCNGLAGGYSLDGSKLTFTQMAGTLMACANGMEIEQKIHRMFSHVAAWKIAGETLQFLDDQGVALATFESRYMN